MAVTFDSYGNHAVVPKLPTYRTPYQQNTDPSAYYTKALGFLPIDTRYLANPTNQLAYNSIADILFNREAQQQRWANSDHNWLASWWATPVRQTVDTFLHLKERAWDPIATGVSEDGWNGFLRGGSTMVINGLVDLGNTLDVVANPIKGFFIDGPEGFKKGLFGDEEGRKQYDYNEYIDWGDGFWNNAGEFLASLGLEIISDPLNWVSWGSKALASTGSKATAKVALKSASEAMQELVEQGTKSIDELIPELIKHTGVSEVTAKNFLREAVEEGTKNVTKEGLNKAFQNSNDLLSKVFTRVGTSDVTDAASIREFGQDLHQSTKPRYKAGIFDKGVASTPATQKFVAEYLTQHSTVLPNILESNKAFNIGSKIGRAGRDFETGLRYAAGATTLTPLIAQYKLGKYASGRINNARLKRMQDAVLRTASDLERVIKFDNTNVEVVKAFGAVDAAAHKEIFDDLLKVKDKFTALLSTQGKAVTKQRLLATVEKMKRRANAVVKKFKRSDITTLDDYIEYFKTMGQVTDTTEYVTTLETLKKFLNLDYANSAVLSDAQAGARALRELINTALPDGQVTAMRNAEDAFRRWRKVQAEAESVTDVLNKNHQGVAEIMEWLEGVTDGTPNIELLDHYMIVARNALDAEKAFTTLLPDGTTEYTLEGFYKTFKESYAKYQAKLDVLDRMSQATEVNEESLRELTKAVDGARNDAARTFQELARSFRANAQFPEYNSNTASVIKNRFGAHPLSKASRNAALTLTSKDATAMESLVKELEQLQIKMNEDEGLQWLRSDLESAKIVDDAARIRMAKDDLKEYITQYYPAYYPLVAQQQRLQKLMDSTPVVDSMYDADALTKFVQDLPKTDISKTDVLANPKDYVKYQLVTYQLMTSKTSFYLDLCGIDSTGAVVNTTDTAPLRALLDEYTDTSSELYKILAQPEKLRTKAGWSSTTVRPLDGVSTVDITDTEYQLHIQPMKDLLDRMQSFIQLVTAANKLTAESHLGRMYQQGFTDQLVTMLSKHKKVYPSQLSKIATEIVDGVDLSISSKLGLQSNSMDSMLRDVTDDVLHSPTASAEAKAIAQEIVDDLRAGAAHEGVTDTKNWLRLVQIADESNVPAVKDLKANFIAQLQGRHAVIYDTETLGTTEKLTRPYQISGMVIGPDLKVVPDSEFNIIIKPDGQLPYESVKRIITPAGQDPRTWFKNNIVNNPNAVTMDEAMNQFYDICQRYDNGNVVLAGQNIRKFDTALLVKQVSSRNKYKPSELEKYFNSIEMFDSLEHFNIRTGFKLQGEQRNLFITQVQRLLADALDANPKLFGQTPFSYKDIGVLKSFDKFATEKGLFQTQFTDAQYNAPTPHWATKKTAPVFQALNDLRQAKPITASTPKSQYWREVPHKDRFRVTRAVSDPSQYAEQAVRNKPYIDPFISNWYMGQSTLTPDSWKRLKEIIEKAKRGEIDITPTKAYTRHQSVFKSSDSWANWYDTLIEFNNKHPKFIKQLETLKLRYNPEYASGWAPLLMRQTDKKAQVVAKQMLNKANKDIDRFIELYTLVVNADPDVIGTKTLEQYITKLQALATEISKPADIAADTSYFIDTAQPELLKGVLDLGNLVEDDVGDLAALASRTAPRTSIIADAIDGVIRQWQAPSKFKGAQYFTVSKLNPKTFEESAKKLVNRLKDNGLINVEPGTSIMEVFTKNVDSGRIIVNPRTVVSYEVNDIFNVTTAVKKFGDVDQPDSLAVPILEQMEHQMRAIKRRHSSLTPELVAVLQPDALKFLRELRKPREDLPKSLRYFAAIRTNLDDANKIAIAEYYYNLLPATHPLKAEGQFKLLGDRLEAWAQIKPLAVEPEYDPTPLLHRMADLDDGTQQPRLMYETSYYNYNNILNTLEDATQIDALLKYYLDKNIYNISDAARHDAVARARDFYDSVEKYLSSKGEVRPDVEKNIRKLNTRLYERALMEILERPDRVKALKAEAKVRASRIVFSTRSRIDLADFKADPDYIVKDNVLLDDAQKLYGHAILIKRAGYDAASADVTLSPKMITDLKDAEGKALLDAEGIQHYTTARQMLVTDAHIKNLGYSKGDVMTKKKILALDKALVDLGWFTQEELALIPSANDLAVFKYFDELNANNSIIGTFPFYAQMFNGDIAYIGDPFKQTLYAISENCNVQHTQVFMYVSAIMNKHNNIKDAALFAPLPRADKFKLLHNNEDVGVYVIRKPTVKTSFYSDHTKTGVVMEEIKIVNEKSIELAEQLGAYIVPRTIASQAMKNINQFILPPIARVAKNISDVYKIAYLGTVGFLIRNFIDSNYKTRWGLDGEVSLPKQVKHLFSTMHMLRKYTETYQTYFDIMQRDFTTDLDYRVFYTICQNLDATEEALIEQVTKDLVSERLQQRATKLTKQIVAALTDETRTRLTQLKIKLLEPDVFSVVDAFDKYGPSSGLAKAIMDSAINPKATNGDRALLQQFNNLMIEKGPFRATYSINEFIEASARLSMYLQDLERGTTLDNAIKNVIRTHFDYDDKTLGMLYAEIVFPFLSFSYKNLDFWIQNISRNPMLVGELENIFRTLLDYQSIFTPDPEAYQDYDYTFDWSKDVMSFQANAPWTMINAARLYHILNGNIVIDTDRDVAHDAGYGTKTNDLYAVFKLSPSVLDAVKMLYTPLNTYTERLLPPYETMLNIVGGLATDQDVVGQMNSASLMNMLPYIDTITQRIGYGEDGLRHNNIVTRIEDAGPAMIFSSVFGAAYVPHKDNHYWYNSDYNILGGFKQNYYAKRNYSNPYNSKYPSYTLTRMAQNKKPKDIYAKSTTSKVRMNTYDYVARQYSNRILRHRLKDSYYYY